MREPSRVFFTDGDVDSAILDVINRAQEQIVLISPYVDLWGQVKDAIRMAVKRGARVGIIVRADELLKDLDWLTDNGVTVLCVPGLHAKIYLNEQTTVIGSINLTANSLLNSHDILLVVSDPETQRDITRYVNETLMPLAEPIQVGTTGRPSPSPRGRFDAPIGFCIRCADPIAPDPNRPLCGDDYEVWAEYENRDYQEAFCHACGRPWATSYARPLCSVCYQGATR